jgi:hypothetical protein
MQKNGNYSPSQMLSERDIAAPEVRRHNFVAVGNRQVKVRNPGIEGIGSKKITICQ